MISNETTTTSSKYRYYRPSSLSSTVGCPLQPNQQQLTKQYTTIIQRQRHQISIPSWNNNNNNKNDNKSSTTNSRTKFSKLLLTTTITIVQCCLYYIIINKVMVVVSSPIIFVFGQQQLEVRHYERRLYQHYRSNNNNNNHHRRLLLQQHHQSAVASSSTTASRIHTTSSSSSLVHLLDYSKLPTTQDNNYETLKASVMIETTKQQQQSQQEHEVVTDPTTTTLSGSTLVLHIGTFKTGSTTIQKHFYRYSELLEQYDNYVLPGNWSAVADLIRSRQENRIRNIKKKKKKRLKDPMVRINMIGLSDCFRYIIDPLHPCSTDIYNQLQNIMISNNVQQQQVQQQQYPTVQQKKKNVLVSSEYFSQLYINVTSVYEFFQPYFNNIIIIGYYRRFYDWVISYWKQITKVQKYNHRQSFIDYVHQEWNQTINQYYNYGPYTYGTIQRWYNTITTLQQHSIKKNTNNCTFHIKLYNLHTIPNHDISNNFFCTAIPNTPNTCQAIIQHESKQQQQQQDKDELSMMYSNMSPKLTYENLLYEAIELYNLTTLGNISGNVYTDKFYFHLLIDKIQQFHTTILNGNDEYDFDIKYKECLSDTVLQWLYDKTIEAEYYFFPDTINRTELQEQFRIDTTTQLCSINVRKLLQEHQQWIYYFRYILS